MTQFLVSSAAEVGSSPQIKSILAGKNVRIASAFLGKGAEDLISKGTRVICDISMGGTNPEVLTVLSKKIGDSLRHLPNFHAKVYISDEGCVIGSANLSNRGVGFLSQATLIEASVFLAPDDKACRAATAWFDEIWEDANVVGPEAIEWARVRWQANKRGAPSGHKSEAKTFFEAVAGPEEEAGLWGYLLTREQIGRRLQRSALHRSSEVVEKAQWVPKSELDVFSDLDKALELDGYYISLHRGKRGKVYSQALRFVGNLEVEDPDEPGDIHVISYFEKLPWSVTGFPSLTKDESSKSGNLSAMMTNLKKKVVGGPITAKKFCKLLAEFLL
ncbi:hypothetical protein EYF88_15725 [Paracoccus sediminis]|uniref:PLD phosphodiesterase domain-containing protein n=1 Tax=Paracoccus sediminis TaxID=1214787 RepID=A0A238YBS5_9RHOB|nr:phospholipase D family protein [Paracoccus sediminis]TBN46964.1 hypothetical protein EYF88_15725 [Paracoccus sediminis]SNR68063.1 hypothetical protein SAMN06265378_11644 [Paracoccus sediminis]